MIRTIEPTYNESIDARHVSSLAVLDNQRSHILLILGRAATNRNVELARWWKREYRENIEKYPNVLGLHLYEQHEIDITQGNRAPLPFRFLGICELSLDGAHAAEKLIEHIGLLHRSQPVASAHATWLYFPMGEKVGRSPVSLPSMLTVAFANATVGHEAEFREWYATRHIRHALNIPALVSGQCFERAQFQKHGAMEAAFSMIAIYEQEGTPESIIESFASLPAGTLDFPTLDLGEGRFAESVYRPI